MLYYLLEDHFQSMHAWTFSQSERLCDSLHQWATFWVQLIRHRTL